MNEIEVQLIRIQSDELRRFRYSGSKLRTQIEWSERDELRLFLHFFLLCRCCDVDLLFLVKQRNQFTHET